MGQLNPYVQGLVTRFT